MKTKRQMSAETVSVLVLLDCELVVNNPVMFLQDTADSSYYCVANAEEKL